MPDKPIIAIIGATGAVGREALAILSQRCWPIDRIIAVASDRSCGTTLPFGSQAVTVEKFDINRLALAQCAILCTDAALSSEYAPLLTSRGVLVIDNSSAFRLDPTVPLVVPEINAETITSDTRLIANPNCSTIIMLLAVEPLRRRMGINEMIVSTYQAVSGAGLAGIEELHEQTRAELCSSELPPRIFPHTCAFNVFPHESPLDPVSGFNGEESKLIAESRRIWNQPNLTVIPTCVRVPVVRAHSQSILVTLDRPARRAEVSSVLASGRGLQIVDDWEASTFPTPRLATGIDDILVGRIRPAQVPSTPDARMDRFLLWVCGDQLRKGAALNAIQIAELLLSCQECPPRSTALRRTRSPTPIGS